VQGKKNTI